jgi:hypothetical protein
MQNIRCRLYQFLKEREINKKTNTTILSIGCSKKHLTDWIKYNIDLDNLNEYHIDHVRPLASFNCKTYEEVIVCKCNHWTNLMPTTPIYNTTKNCREPTKHELFKQELRIYLFSMDQLTKKFNKMKVTELKEYCKKKEIKNISKLRKKEIIEIIKIINLKK